MNQTKHVKDVDTEVLQIVSASADEDQHADANSFLTGDWGDKHESLELVPADFLEIKLKLEKVFEVKISNTEMAAALIARAPSELGLLKKAVEKQFVKGALEIDEDGNLNASSDELDEQMKGSAPLTVARLSQYIRTKIES